jgi:hypothetical protein
MFEIWRFSKSLVVYPEGYKLVPSSEFQGLDGTVPDLKEEFKEQELGATFREWLQANRESKIQCLHSNDPFWKLVCQLADATSTDTLNGSQLSLVFNVDTGERQDQAIEVPRRLRDFLDNLKPEQEQKLIDFISNGGLDGQK